MSYYRNEKTIEELKKEQGDLVRIIKNPKTGKTFFTCGKITGYVSPKVNWETVSAEELNYVEIYSVEIEKWIPAIYLRKPNIGMAKNVEKNDDEVVLTVHPHKGYLNTTYKISCTGLKDKRLVIIPIKSKTQSILYKHPTYYDIDKNKFSLNYKFDHFGTYEIRIEGNEECTPKTIIVKDAIKFGGSTHKNSYVFDETPWCFVVMKDRTYFYNRDSGEEYVESISPDKISYVNKNIVLLSNDKHKENTLYSLTEQTPIITFADEILLQDDILIVKYETNNVTKLNVYRFTDTIIDKKEYECEDFSVCKESRILCIYKNQQIDVISLDSFETIKNIFNDNEFIKFTNGHYYVELRQQISCTVISVKDILSDQTWYIPSEYPISSCEGIEINDIHAEEIKVEKLLELAGELDLFNTKKPEFLGGIDISYKHIKIQGLYVLSKQLYYLVNECSYTINRYCAKRKRSNLFLKISDCDFKLEVYNNFPTIKFWGDSLCITTFNHISVIKGKEITYNADATIHQFKNKIIISRKNNYGTEDVYELSNGKTIHQIRGIFDWRYFEKYGILEQKEEKALYAFSSQENASFHKLDFNNSSSYLTEFPSENTLRYSGRYLYYHGVMLWNEELTLPENITALSEKKNYAISIKGSHVFLGRISGTKDSFVNEEILESLFDSSSYGNVLMSDNGKNIIFQKDKEMFLMNTETKEVQNFPNLNFISQINGYRPLFKVDDSHRRPRIIDPLTKEYINQDFITNYGFVSPDGNLYADSALSKYVKYHDKVNDTFISKEQWHALAEKYDYEWKIDDKTKDEKKEARKEFIYAHKNFFNGEKIDDLLKINDFKDKIAEELGYAIIRKTGTDEIYCEIELGHVLWFLNYVAFSYDSRYIAIAGRYPNNTEINGYCVSGLFLVYDMIKQKVIANSTTSYAVWTTAFTKNGFYAAYDSHPILLCGNVCNNENIKEVRNRNFLTFSPDGKYMALSNQGYVSYNSKNSNWGHQPSTSVYIHAVNNPNEQIMPTIDDLSDTGIADTNEAKSVSSCSFSLNNKKLMMVGNDGTVVIRNLHLY